MMLRVRASNSCDRPSSRPANWRPCSSTVAAISAARADRLSAAVAVVCVERTSNASTCAPQARVNSSACAARRWLNSLPWTVTASSTAVRWPATSPVKRRECVSIRSVSSSLCSRIRTSAASSRPTRSCAIRSPLSTRWAAVSLRLSSIAMPNASSARERSSSAACPACANVAAVASPRRESTSSIEPSRAAIVSLTRSPCVPIASTASVAVRSKRSCNVPACRLIAPTARSETDRKWSPIAPARSAKFAAAFSALVDRSRDSSAVRSAKVRVALSA